VDITLGELPTRTGRAKEAIEAFRRALAAQPNNFDALLGLARAYDAGGDAPRAEETYRRAVQLQPSYFAGHSKLAGFYFNHGRYAQAAEMFRRVTELTPDNARAFANLGAAYFSMGDFDRALAAYKKSLELEPNDVAYTNIGTAEFFLGHYKESSDALEKAAALTPGHFQLWANLGDAYRWSRGMEAKAAAAYAKAIELAEAELRFNPRHGLAHSLLALCLAKTGRTREAQEHVNAAISLESKNPTYLYNAAVVSNLNGRSRETVGWIRRAVEAGYAAALIERDPELRNIRGDKAFQEALKGTGAKQS